MERAIVCWETGETFPSVAAAAEAVGCSRSGIYAAARERRTYWGLHWYYGDQPRPGESELKPPGGGSAAGRKSIPVRCVETGEVFPSAKAVADQLGVTDRAVGMAIRRKNRCKGLHWEHVRDESGD